MTVDAALRVPKDRPWLRHYDRAVPHHLVYPDEPLHSFLDDTAERHPDAVATIFGGAVGHRLLDAKLTYHEVSELADRFAGALQDLGVAKGDRVALVLPNCPQFVYAFFGTLRAGGVVVPTNPLYTVPELRHQLADSGAETVVVLSRLYPAVAEAALGTAVRRILVTNIKEHFPPVLRALFTLARERKEGHRVDISGDKRASWLRDALASARPRRPVTVRPADTAVLQYTGGTTGIAKGAILSHRALVANAVQCRAWNWNVREARHVALAVMPFFHVYGLTVVLIHAVHSASAMVLIPRFDLRHVLLSIQKHRPQAFAGAPRIYIAVNNAPDLEKYDLRSIESFISGSAPLATPVLERFERLTGGKVVEGYGLTEMAPVTHSNPLGGERKIGSVGLPFPDVDARIVDLETGTRDVPVGEAGEIVMRGPNMMDGYYLRPDETAAVLRDGWLYTGDIGKMDEDGYFYIVDRKKELIIVSGFNVYPREVDEVLFAHPAVQEAAAIGVPHPERGECVHAYVVLRPGMTTTEEELIEHCRRSLARFKVPERIVFRSELPKSLVGKVLRRELAKEASAAG
ncbi:MAG TPA: long-chain fatty acid--CoA ligase [Candidatus Limnocylindria bacterium]|nr:long-chain fatty acid--CoA ligase [Candidatus Limnocylindria bacterium]